MKAYNNTILIALGIGLTLLIGHFIYVHAQLLDFINSDNDWYMIRSYFFSISYSFMTIIAISLLQNEKINISVVNVIGIRVLQFEYFAGTNDRINVSVSKLQSGIYFIQAESQGQLATRKIMVQ